MFSFYKKIFSLLLVLQLLAAHGNAETTVHTDYFWGVTVSTMTTKLNAELQSLQIMAEAEGKFFELLDMSITFEQAFSVLLYKLSDRLGEVNPLITRVAYVGAWTGIGLVDELQKKLTIFKI